jgi:hypothetical protein
MSEKEWQQVQIGFTCLYKGRPDGRNGKPMIFCGWRDEESGPGPVAPVSENVAAARLRRPETGYSSCQFRIVPALSSPPSAGHERPEQ